MTESLRFERIDRIEQHQLSDELTAMIESNDSLFCSVGFAQVWKSVGGRPVWWIARGETGIVAVLAGVEFGRRPIVRFQALPDGCYARLLSDDASRYASAVLQAIGSFGYARTFIHDFNNIFSKTDLFRADTCSTTLVDISSAGWEPSDRTLRSALRRAAKEGVVLDSFDSNRHMDAFIELMEATERRHGRTTKYSRPFFEALAHLAENDDRIVWRWCEHEGRPVCSHVYVREQDQLIYWQSYSDREFSFLKANQYMIYRTVQMMTQNGVRVLNLGASPEESDSLQAYKDRWGGRKYEYQRLMAKAGVGKFL